MFADSPSLFQYSVITRDYQSGVTLPNPCFHSHRLCFLHKQRRPGNEVD